LSDRYLDPILAWSASRLAPAEIPTRVLPEKPTALLAAARYLYPSDDAVAERRELFEKALNLLAAQTEPLTGEELHAKIQLLRQLGRKELALEVCQATLAEQPRLADCRFELADMLFQQGKLEQSLWQLEIVLDQSPAHTGASELSQVVRRKIAEEGQRRPEKRQGASNPR
jgi:thioredoxin-like negative regulator of GroEL